MLRIILLFLASLAIIRSSLGQHESSSNGSNLIQSDAFRLAKAQEIINYLDASADPCQNYYQFACGNWHKHFPATKYEIVTESFGNSEKEFNGIVSTVMNHSNPTDTASERKIKNFYASCMKVSAMTQTEYRSGMKKLIKEFGKMPMLEGKKWQLHHFDWLQTVGEISNKYGVNIFFKFTITLSVDSTSNAMVLGPQKFVLEDTSAHGINMYVVKVTNDLVNFLGIKKSIAKLAAASIAKFEATLVKAVEKSEEDVITARISNLKLPVLDLLKLTNITFGYVPSGTISITKTEYLPELINIMKKTPKATVANYIFYHLLREFKVNVKADNRKYLCAEDIKSFFPDVLSKMLFRVYRLQDRLIEYRHLWQDIVAALKMALESDRLSWYDDANREFALEKLHLLKLYLATFEDNDLDGEYEGLNLNVSGYMENVKAIKSFKARKTRSSLDMSADIIADIVNFFSPLYNKNINSVIFSVSSLLTSIFVVQSIPNALKYSRMGFIFGHELSHGFSGNSRLYDRLGHNLGTIGGIEDDYEERKNCIYDQYHNYGITGKTARLQDESQSENIADIAGIALAYSAYSLWLANGDRTKEELDMETLPHLNYTNKQLFFIYYSQTWCSDYTPLFDKLSAGFKHSHSSFRAVLPLINFDEFAKAFNCPLGSNMNPRKKCTLY